jgi:hypothetical protein
MAEALVDDVPVEKAGAPFGDVPAAAERKPVKKQRAKRSRISALCACNLLDASAVVVPTSMVRFCFIHRYIIPTALR